MGRPWRTGTAYNTPSRCRPTKRRKRRSQTFIASFSASIEELRTLSRKASKKHLQCIVLAFSTSLVGVSRRRMRSRASTASSASIRSASSNGLTAISASAGRHRHPGGREEDAADPALGKAVATQSRPRRKHQTNPNDKRRNRTHPQNRGKAKNVFTIFPSSKHWQ